VRAGISVGTSDPPPIGSADQGSEPVTTAPVPDPPAGPSPAHPVSKHRTRNRWLVVLLVLVVVLGGLGTGAYVANASLSSTYSPERAVTDFFAAQKRGDVKGMMSNATFLRGDGSFADLFGQGELDAMLGVKQNLDLQNVKVTSTSVIDDSTRSVTVSMTWSGTPRSIEYLVRKDPTRVHYQFYSSWLVQVPYVQLTVTLPTQGGAIMLDGLPLPPTATNTIQTIRGFHSVTMLPNFLYDGQSQVVDATYAAATATFSAGLSSSSKAAAATAVKAGFNNCDPAHYLCYGHRYNAPVIANTIVFLMMPGYPEIDYTYYVVSMTTDPTTAMTLVVTTQAGVLNVSGPCADTLTVDGSRTYHFKGSFSGTLTWANGAFTPSIGWNCETSQA